MHQNLFAVKVIIVEFIDIYSNKTIFKAYCSHGISFNLMLVENVFVILENIIQQNLL